MNDEEKNEFTSQEEYGIEKKLERLSIQIKSTPIKDVRKSKRTQYEKDCAKTKIFIKERQANLHRFFHKN